MEKENTIININDLELRMKIENYIKKNNIDHVFNQIFQELIVNQIPIKDHFAYTASKLNEFN